MVGDLLSRVSMRKSCNWLIERFPAHRVAAHGAPDTVLCAVQPAAAGRQLCGSFQEAARVSRPQKAGLSQLARRGARPFCPFVSILFRVLEGLGFRVHPVGLECYL